MADHTIAAILVGSFLVACCFGYWAMPIVIRLLFYLHHRSLLPWRCHSCQQLRWWRKSCEPCFDEWRKRQAGRWTRSL